MINLLQIKLKIECKFDKRLLICSNLTKNSDQNCNLANGTTSCPQNSFFRYL